MINPPKHWRTQQDQRIEDERKAQELLLLCQGFIKKQRIQCEETIFQTDWVAENSLDFIHQVCEIVGYNKE